VREGKTRGRDGTQERKGRRGDVEKEQGVDLDPEELVSKGVGGGTAIGGLMYVSLETNSVGESL
jgi:hypothetical protein